MTTDLMKITANKIQNRFENLRQIQKDTQAELIQVSFTEREIKEIIYCMGYLEALCELPSAEPEIIRCKDCKHYWKNDDELAICLASPKDDAFCSEGVRQER